MKIKIDKGLMNEWMDELTYFEYMAFVICPWARGDLYLRQESK